ncbi:MAG: transcription termination factor NusA [Pirellula sp.]|jgi:N utilization substance protein A|nr:transcription termination factor NusA [Pirellula sp.]
MNPQDLLRIVDSLHREKQIDPELVMQAIEAALITAAKRQFGEEAEVDIHIVRGVGAINATVDGKTLSQDEIGRIGAQTAKQVIIQKLKEAERDARLEEFHEQVGQLITGIVQRTEKGLTIVQLGNVEAILPKNEQIPGEAYHNGSRVRAVIYEVKAAGNRVKIILSRTKGTLVQRLFEQEVPEIAEGVIKINAISREPGYRSKVAVSSTDQRIDCVGACVGMRGNRIKNVTSELAGERIDIVRWSDDPMVLIPNALQPAQVEQVLLCDMIGRAIALVNDEHLSQAIGRFGQNVRLASKLCGWDIEIMTAPELERQIERAMEAFMQIDGMTEEVAQQLVEQGYLSFDDLSVIEPEALIEMGGYSEDQVNSIVEQAEDRAAEQEAEEEARKRQDKLDKERRASEELDRLEKLEAAGKVPVAAEQPEASVEDSPAPESGAESEEPVAGAEEPATGAESLESPSEPRVEG